MYVPATILRSYLSPPFFAKNATPEIKVLDGSPKHLFGCGERGTSTVKSTFKLGHGVMLRWRCETARDSCRSFLSFLFPQIAFAIGVLTSSLGVGDRGISGFVAVIFIKGVIGRT